MAHRIKRDPGTVMKAPRGQGSQARVRLPKKGGETYTWALDAGGQAAPRCRGCGKVVPMSKWFQHFCGEAPF